MTITNVFRASAVGVAAVGAVALSGGISQAAPAGTVVDPTALPVAATAKWQPVTQKTRETDFLTGISLCSPYGKPPADRVEPQAKATGKVSHYAINPGNGGDTLGWRLEASFAPYGSVESAITALNSYKRFIENCPLADGPADNITNDGGISVLDPTAAHGIVVTYDRYVAVWAVATDTGIAEVTATHPRVPEVSIGYNPRSLISALKEFDPSHAGR